MANYFYLVENYLSKMSCVQVLSLVLVLASLNYVQSKKLCDLANIKCTTKGAQSAYGLMMPGIQNICEPLDPIHLNDFAAEYLALKYKTSNNTLTGMSNCLYTLLKMDPEELTYHSEFLCPKLVLRYHYISKGFFGPAEIDGSGFATATFYDYKIVVDGSYGHFISEKDNKLHFYVITYLPKFEPKGPMTLNLDTLHSDAIKDAHAKNYITKLGKEKEIVLRSIYMYKYIHVVFKELNNYVRNVAVEDIFYE